MRGDGKKDKGAMAEKKYERKKEKMEKEKSFISFIFNFHMLELFASSCFDRNKFFVEDVLS